MGCGIGVLGVFHGGSGDSSSAEFAATRTGLMARCSRFSDGGVANLPVEIYPQQKITAQPPGLE